MIIDVPNVPMSSQSSMGLTKTSLSVLSVTLKSQRYSSQDPALKAPGKAGMDNPTKRENRMSVYKVINRMFDVAKKLTQIRKAHKATIAKAESKGASSLTLTMIDKGYTEEARTIITQFSRELEAYK